MHWFWRATISAVVAYLYFVLSAGAAITFGETVKGWVQFFTGRNPFAHSAIPLLFFSWVLPAAIVFGLSFLLLTRFCNQPFRGQTRCRKCGYILRGISEPRCPECGERI